MPDPATIPDWARPGQVIIEKHREWWCLARRIVAVHDSFITTVGVESGRQTQISARNLYRYRPVEQ